MIEASVHLPADEHAVNARESPRYAATHPGVHGRRGLPQIAADSRERRRTARRASPRHMDKRAELPSAEAHAAYFTVHP